MKHKDKKYFISNSSCGNHLGDLIINLAKAIGINMNNFGSLSIF